MILRSFRLAAVAATAAVLVAACSGSSSTVPPVSSSGASASPSAAATAGAVASSGAGGCPTSQPAALPAGQVRDVTLKTSQGDIVIKVEGALSPIAAGNFVALAQCGYYDGSAFHRIVPGFVIQGGASKTGGGPGYTIQDEPVTATYGRGVVAMARTSQPNSQDSQFFIVLDDAAREALQSYNTYAIFGTVISGMDVVDKIATMPNSGPPNNLATPPVPIVSATVTTP